MSAFKPNKKEKQSQMLGDSPENILRRKRAIESSVGDNAPATAEPVGIAAEKPVGVLCFLPKSIHRLASRYAEDSDLTAKRFFFELILSGLEQKGIITQEQHAEALTLPKEYGWKGRKTDGSSSD